MQLLHYKHFVDTRRQNASYNADSGAKCVPPKSAFAHLPKVRSYIPCVCVCVFSFMPRKSSIIAISVDAPLHSESININCVLWLHATNNCRIIHVWNCNRMRMGIVNCSSSMLQQLRRMQLLLLLHHFLVFSSLLSKGDDFSFHCCWLRTNLQ